MTDERFCDVMRCSTVIFFDCVDVEVCCLCLATAAVVLLSKMLQFNVEVFYGLRMDESEFK